MGIDFSNEGLAARIMDVDPAVAASGDTVGDTVGTDSGAQHAEAVTADPTVDVEETPAVAEEESTEEVEEVADEQPPAEDDSEESNEPDPADATAEVADPEEETYRQRYENLVTKLGEQGKELGEYRKLAQELEALKSQLAQQQEEPALRRVAEPSTVQELLDQAAEPHTARDAFDFALDRAPDLIPDVLAEVQLYDPAYAKRLELEYVETMLGSRVDPVQNRIQRVDEDAATIAAVQQFSASVPEWGEIKEDVAAIVEQEPWLMGSGSQEEVQRGLAWATRMVKQQRDVQAQIEAAQKAAATAQRAAQRQQSRQEASVETGSPGATPPPEEVDPAEVIRRGIFADDERVRRARA